MLHIGFEMNPGVSIGLEFFDDFNRANGPLGPNWVGTGVTISGGHADLSAGLKYSIFQPELPSSDMWTEADILAPSSASFGPGVTARNQSGVTFDPCYFFRFSNGGWQLMRVGDVDDVGSYSELVTVPADYPGNPFRMRLEVEGTNPVLVRGYQVFGGVGGSKVLKVSYSHSGESRVIAGQRGGFRNRISDGAIDNFAVGVLV